MLQRFRQACRRAPRGQARKAQDTPEDILWKVCDARFAHRRGSLQNVGRGRQWRGRRRRAVRGQKAGSREARSCRALGAQMAAAEVHRRTLERGLRTNKAQGRRWLCDTASSVCNEMLLRCKTRAAWPGPSVGRREQRGATAGARRRRPASSLPALRYSDQCLHARLDLHRLHNGSCRPGCSCRLPAAASSSRAALGFLQLPTDALDRIAEQLEAADRRAWETARAPPPLLPPLAATAEQPAARRCSQLAKGAGRRAAAHMLLAAQ